MFFPNKMSPFLPLFVKLLLLPLVLWLWFDTSTGSAVRRWLAPNFDRAGSSESQPVLLNPCSSTIETLDTFNRRDESDRFVKGTRPTLIKNATVFTGTAGRLVVHGDVFVDKGIIRDFGDILDLDLFPPETSFVNAQGAWLTPGLST